MMGEWLSINPNIYDPLFSNLDYRVDDLLPGERHSLDETAELAIDVAQVANSHDLRWVVELASDEDEQSIGYLTSAGINCRYPDCEENPYSPLVVTFISKSEALGTVQPWYTDASDIEYYPDIEAVWIPKE